MEEAGVDVTQRIKIALQKVAPPGFTVRIALEDGSPYFAGLLRLMNRSALLHADYGPFVNLPTLSKVCNSTREAKPSHIVQDGPTWEVGVIMPQLT